MKEGVRQNLRRGVFIIPTSLTVLNVFFGFTAIMTSIRAGQAALLGDADEAARLFRLAFWCLAIAAVFDTFDGLVARLMHATSEFGKEYDSLADIVTFGVAPAVLVYSWSLHLWGRLGAGVAFLFLVAGSIRLARFNVMTAKIDSRYFIGLPIPAAALTIGSIVNYAPYPVTDERFALVMLIITATVAFAMVSTVRYRSQKFSSLQKERSFMFLILLAVMLVVMSRWPTQFFFFGSIIYFASGPAMRLWTLAFPRPVEIPVDDDDTDPGILHG